MAASASNLEIILRARPEGALTADLFEVRTGPVPEPGPGQCLIRVIYLSLDPAMRGWIAEAPNYMQPVPLGAVMSGFTVGEIAISNHPAYRPGDIVYGKQGWRTWAVSDGSDILRIVEPNAAPLSTALHILGHTGLTAYLGLLEVGRPRAGETVLVSTAAGAVGSAVGQIAKIKGCRAVGLTGTDEKVGDCLETFGFDAAINYRAASDLSGALAAACPQGIDVYFDNVGGPISDAVLELINVGARIVVCGTMGIAAGREGYGPRPNRALLIKRARMEGFLVLDHMARLPEALGDLSVWVREGRVRYLEDIAEGLEAAPEALVRLLSGKNRGKMMVRVGPETA